MVCTRFLVTTSLAALLSLAGAAHAATSATVLIQSGTAPHHQVRPMQPVHYQPPPPPRHERAQAPRRGMQWSQGHWEWRGQRYVWVPGQWVRARHGQDYRQPHWEQRRGQWHYVAGGWNGRGRGPAHRYDGRPRHAYRH